MYKYKNQPKPTWTVVKVQEIKDTWTCSDKASRLLLLPTELQMKIFVFSQNPLMIQTCKHFWDLGKSTSLRVDYLMYRYGPLNVLQRRALSRNIVTPQVIEHLLNHKECDPSGDDWLFTQACHSNQTQLSEWIIEATRRYHGQSALNRLCAIAAMEGSIPVIDLLAHHIDIHQPNGQELALRMACQQNKVDLVIHLHQQYQCNIHYQNELYLRNACLYGYDDLVDYLLHSGADVHAYHDAAIHNAVHKGHASTVKKLLEYGASAQSNQNACTRLAIQQGNLEILQHLVSIGGVDPSYQHNWPLRHACKYGFDDIVKYLLDVPSAHVDFQDGVLLEIVFKYGRLSTLELLLIEYKANTQSQGMQRGIEYISKHNVENKYRILKLLKQLGIPN